jgi:hypothetical protein
MNTLDQRASAAWSQAAREVNASLDEVLQGLRSSSGGRGWEDGGHGAVALGSRDAEVSALLRRVAAAVEAPRGPALPTLVLIHGAGILAAGGAVALVYGAYRLVAGWLGG